MADVLFPTMSQHDLEAEGVVSTWFVATGDTVEEGDLIAEVAMDKVDMEIPAPQAGTVTILVPEEEAVVQGTPIASIT